MSNLAVRAATSDGFAIYAELPTNCRVVGNRPVSTRIFDASLLKVGFGGWPMDTLRMQRQLSPAADKPTHTRWTGMGHERTFVIAI